MYEHSYSKLIQYMNYPCNFWCICYFVIPLSLFTILCTYNKSYNVLTQLKEQPLVPLRYVERKN
jgi:hypothetical protein